jgi:hypothetical protein
MTPTVPIVLNGLARTLLMDLAPQVSAAYAGQTLQLSGALAMMIAQEFERAAARLVEENAAIDSILVDGGDPAPAWDGSLLVSALQARNRELRAALIRLHAAVESRSDPDSQALEARIWAELVESTRRRTLDMALSS